MRVLALPAYSAANMSGQVLMDQQQQRGMTYAVITCA